MKAIASLAIVFALIAGGTVAVSAQAYIPLTLDGSPNGYQVYDVVDVGGAGNVFTFKIKIVRVEKAGKPLAGKTCTVKVSIGRVGSVRDRRVTLNARGSGTVSGNYTSNVDPRTANVSVGVACP